MLIPTNESDLAYPFVFLNIHAKSIVYHNIHKKSKSTAKVSERSLLLVLLLALLSVIYVTEFIPLTDASPLASMVCKASLIKLGKACINGKADT